MFVNKSSLPVKCADGKADEGIGSFNGSRAPSVVT
jgi:hypothetical protein